ncbi:MAG: hypothetical protein HGB14_10260 [Anaerolineaceae bacterium]|nr:hypothetical protein [Anaerolineaceae bacterium]
MTGGTIYVNNGVATCTKPCSDTINDLKDRKNSNAMEIGAGNIYCIARTKGGYETTADTSISACAACGMLKERAR